MICAATPGRMATARRRRRPTHACRPLPRFDHIAATGNQAAKRPSAARPLLPLRLPAARPRTSRRSSSATCAPACRRACSSRRSPRRSRRRSRRSSAASCSSATSARSRCWPSTTHWPTREVPAVPPDPVHARHAAGDAGGRRGDDGRPRRSSPRTSSTASAPRSTSPATARDAASRSTRAPWTARTTASPTSSRRSRKLPGDFLLDGEIVPWRDGCVLPFAHIQKRLGRKVLTPKILRDNPAVFIAFDILYRDGELLMDSRSASGATAARLWRRRRRAAAQRLFTTAIADVTTADEIAARFAAARDCRNEGLVLKDPESPYSPGRRGQVWLKIKTHLPTLDCVVTAAEYGHGKRRNSLSDYTFAVWDRDPAVPRRAARQRRQGLQRRDRRGDRATHRTVHASSTVRQYGRVRAGRAAGRAGNRLRPDPAERPPRQRLRPALPADQADPLGQAPAGRRPAGPDRGDLRSTANFARPTRHPARRPRRRSRPCSTDWTLSGSYAFWAGHCASCNR